MNDKKNNEYYHLNGLQMSLVEAPYDHKFFFDASDLISMVQGVAGCYSLENSNWTFNNRFDRKRTLIQNLVFSGIINRNAEINVLPAHQAELYLNLKNLDNNSFFASYNQREVINNFFQDVFGNEVESFKNVSTHSTTYFHDILYKNLTSNPENAAKLFKCLYLLYKLHWTERLFFLFKEKKYCVIETHSKINDISNDNLFVKLKMAWDSMRKESEEGNNYKDSIAMFYLSKFVKEYNDNSDNPIPVFYDSSGKFNEILKISTELKQHFQLKVTDMAGKFYEFSAIRDHYYFETFALVNSNNRKFVNFDNSYKDLINKYDYYKNSKFDRIITSIEKPSEVADFLEKFNGDIESYIKFNFIRIVVAPSFNKEPFDKIQSILNWDSANFQSISNRISYHYKNEAKQILQNLESDFNLISISQNALNDINVKTLELSVFQKSTSNNSTNIDIFYDYSLFRFSLPKEIKVQLSILFSADGLLAGETPKRLEAQMKLLDHYFKIITFSPNEDSINNIIDDIYIVSASFWVLSLNSYIQNLELDYGSSPTSLLMLIAASIINIKVKSEKIVDKTKKLDNLLQILEKRRKNSAKDIRAQIDIALAYINFQIWIKDGGAIFSLTSKVPFSYSASLNTKAIFHAREAYNYYTNAETSDDEFKLYSTNLYLYYTSDGGSEEEFETLDKVIEKFFILNNSNPQLWHFRYDDTIARYYYRRSKTITGKEAQLTLARLADQTLIDAISSMKNKENIREVRNMRYFQMSIKSYIAQLLS